MQPEPSECARVYHLRTVRRRALLRRLARFALSMARRASLHCLVAAGFYVPDLLTTEPGEPD